MKSMYIFLLLLATTYSNVEEDWNESVVETTVVNVETIGDLSLVLPVDIIRPASYTIQFAHASAPCEESE